jgi:hypothetical protein
MNVIYYSPFQRMKFARLPRMSRSISRFGSDVRRMEFPAAIAVRVSRTLARWTIGADVFVRLVSRSM